MEEQHIPLDVMRHGHINHFTRDCGTTLAVLRDGFGGRAFSEWETPAAGSYNALVSLGPACVELFAPRDSALAVGQWLARRPAGWHSLEWTVPDLDDAARELKTAGIRITERTDDYLFTHPKDLHGLALELTWHRFAGDPREEGAGSSPGESAARSPSAVRPSSSSRPPTRRVPPPRSLGSPAGRRTSVRIRRSAPSAT